MSPTVTASILAIGTELTSGQTVNSNAQWMSQRLEEIGISVVLHETVADDHTRILQALDRCAAAADLLFVTGGLGPTTDDFTRDVLSKWSGKDLVFDEKSWQRIIQLLTGRGIRVADSNRQQCFFPVGSEIFENPQGTANGFAFTHASKKIWVLPGPPREGQAIWDLHLQSALNQSYPLLQPDELKIWNCLGKSESELGEIVETALRGSGLKTGYRAHVPYIEIKVWIPVELSRTPLTRSALERLEKAIEPWIVTRGKEDLAENFLNALKMLSSRRFVIQDGATFGTLTERLAPKLRDKNHRSLAKVIQIENRFHPSEPVPASPLASSTYQASIFTLEHQPRDLPTDPPEWKISARFSNDRYETILLSHYRGQIPAERLNRHLTELAMQTWLEWIHTSLDTAGHST